MTAEGGVEPLGLDSARGHMRKAAPDLLVTVFSKVVRGSTFLHVLHMNTHKNYWRNFAF